MKGFDISAYSYDLPKELIASSPAEPRDSSRLFVYDTAREKISFDTFKNLANFLPEKSLLVLNDTKVIPARIFLTKETGGKVEILFLMNEWREGNSFVKGMVDRKVEVGDRLHFDTKHFVEAVAQDAHVFLFKPNFNKEMFVRLLEEKG